jgi:hypothetical protein
MPAATISDASETIREMPMLRPRRFIVGMTLMYSFIAGFSLLAMLNLLRMGSSGVMSIFSSIAWLSLVTIALIGIVRLEGGTRQFVINRMGDFSLRHFACVEHDQNNSPVLRFGYRMFARKFYVFAVELNGITSVNWHSGQGTMISGRDMDDWSVGLWYETGKLRSSPGVDDLRDAKNVFIVGQTGPKTQVESFGRSFVEFLQSAGAPLVKVDGEDRWNRTQ